MCCIFITRHVVSIPDNPHKPGDAHSVLHAGMVRRTTVPALAGKFLKSSGFFSGTPGQFPEEPGGVQREPGMLFDFTIARTKPVAFVTAKFAKHILAVRHVAVLPGDGRCAP